MRFVQLAYAALGALALSLPIAPTWAVTPTVSVGASHSCALRRAGTVDCWGWSGGYLNSVGFADERRGVTSVPGIADAIELVSGAAHNCVLLSNRRVACWGNNEKGQLGAKTSEAFSAAPVEVERLDSVQALAAGASHTCALTVNKQIYCWGTQFMGGALYGTSSDYRALPFFGTYDVARMRSGPGAACIVSTLGRVSCWGTLGVASPAPFDTPYQSTAEFRMSHPTELKGITDAVDVAVGSGHVCALTRDGRVWCWGNNNTGQLGVGNTQSSLAPLLVPGIEGAISVHAGWSHTCARLANGEVRCWGDNQYGVLGYLLPVGTPLSPFGTAVVDPVTSTVFPHAQGLSLGGTHGCAVLANDAVRCAGTNWAGELGHGCRGEIDGGTHPAIITGSVVGQCLVTAYHVVLAYAERAMPTLFRAPGADSTAPEEGLRYRTYPGGHHLIVNDAGPARLTYLGPLSNGQPLDLGSLFDWFYQVDVQPR